MKNKNLKTQVEFVDDYRDYKRGEIHTIPLKLFKQIKNKVRIIWRTKK